MRQPGEGVKGKNEKYRTRAHTRTRVEQRFSTALLHRSPDGRRQRNGSRAAKRKLWAVGNSCSRFSSPGGKQTIGAGTTSEVYSTRLTGGRCEATRKRIFALRPFAPHRLPSPPLRHGMAFRFHCMSNSSTRRAHNMATSCTHKEWTTAVAILSPKRV